MGNRLREAEACHKDTSTEADLVPGLRPPRAADVMQYTPETAIHWGLARVKELERDIAGMSWSTAVGLQNPISRLKSVELKNTRIGLFGGKASTQTREDSSRVLTWGSATGVGKSYLINALLDDHILPVSCMGACTSTVTEVHYHDEPFIKAEVVFMSEDEWRAEIEVLVENDDDAPGSSCSPVDSVAWAKVHAVYPSLLMSDLINMSADEILDLDPRIRGKLGCTESLTAPNSRAFARRIADYLSNTHQPRSSPQQSINVRASGRSRFMPRTDTSPYPVIKLVKIWYKAAVLETGAVLVDVPGVSDANDARNSIAKDLLLHCDHAFLVANATRAVDDRSTRNLLGKALSAQLKNQLYDSQKITFVVTKTDSDVDPDEILLRCNARCEPEVEEMETTLSAIDDRLRTIRNPNSDDAHQVLDHDHKLNILQCSLESLEGHLRDLDDSTAVTNLAPFGFLTAQSPQVPVDSHNLETNLGGVTAISLCNVDDGEELDMSPEKLKKRIRDVKRKIASLTESQQKMDKQKQDEIINLEDKKRSIERDMKSYCSLKRSKWCISNLKNAFREELNAEAVANENIVPFCFTEVKDTGIPDLRDWCRYLAHQSRNKVVEQFFARLQALAEKVQAYLNLPSSSSLSADRRHLQALWDSESISRSGPAPGGSPLHGCIGISGRLTKYFHPILDDSIQNLRTAVDSWINSACYEGATLASNAAPGFIDAFVKDNRIRYQTFRAMLRRQGEFRHDLNEALAGPLLVAISDPWTNTFQQRYFLPMKERLMSVVKKIFQEFQASAPQSLRVKVDIQLICTTEHASSSLDDILHKVEKDLEGMQKSISRHPVHHVKAQLADTYGQAVLETGRGSYFRQRECLKDDLQDNGEAMFTTCADIVLGRLDKAVKKIRDGLDVSLSDLSQEIESELANLWLSTQPMNLTGPSTSGAITATIQKTAEDLTLWTNALNRAKSARRNQYDCEVDSETASTAMDSTKRRKSSSSSADVATSPTLPDVRDAGASLTSTLAESPPPSLPPASTRPHAISESDLPPEALARVFAWLSIIRIPLRINYWIYDENGKARDGNTDKLGWIKVTHVCRRWRKIALENPALWADITFMLGPNWTATMLQRAQNVPVRIKPRKFRKLGAEVKDYIPQNLSHIQELSLENSYEFLGPLLDAIVAPAPILEYLRLACSGTSPMPFPSTAFSGSTPRLRRLCLEGWSVPWESPIFNTVVDLEIVYPETGDHTQLLPSLPQLLDALERMSSLQHLKLECVLPVYKRPVKKKTPSGPRRVALPRLLELKLSGKVFECVQFIEALTLPPTTVLTITKLWSHGSQDDFDNIIPLLAQRCYKSEGVAHEFRTVRASLYGQDLHISGSLALGTHHNGKGARTPFSVNFVFPMEEPTTEDHALMLQKLFTGLPLSHMKVLEITSFDRDLQFAVEHWLTMLRSLENLEELEVSDVGGMLLCEALVVDVEDYLENASWASRSTKIRAKRPENVFLPHLKSLTLDRIDFRAKFWDGVSVFHMRLIALLKARKKWEVPLKQLDLNKCDIIPSWARKLTDVVDEVLWDGLDDGVSGKWL
ncbi:hypothetical protein BV25DRAFT_1915708 [Artomyces pyxidatus]|uniref:Uncharacterized protein n=1 Tax=Artomyces pyxidatus TaxID=48021 RepID=A0ACB8T4D7_9AGAM|nr:hypothetical protein BV25DRAFT_1915708 [Artomyces pyxidatus]